VSEKLIYCDVISNENENLSIWAQFFAAAVVALTCLLDGFFQGLFNKALQGGKK
jgi:hypothetical protein